MIRQVELAKVAKHVSFKDGELYIGDKKVHDSTAKEGEEYIPALYTIRTPKDELMPGFMRLVTTMDLMPTGLIWLCGSRTIFYTHREHFDMPSAHYDDFRFVKRILAIHEDLWNDTSWEIFEEEDFSSPYDNQEEQEQD